MYKAFQKEQFNRLTIEEDYGFITYEVFEDNSAYIHILYVKPEARGEHKGSLKLESQVIEKHNIKELYCFVDLESNTPEQSLGCIFKAGYRIHHATEKKIVLRKVLE